MNKEKYHNIREAVEQIEKFDLEGYIDNSDFRGAVAFIKERAEHDATESERLAIYFNEMIDSIFNEVETVCGKDSFLLRRVRKIARIKTRFCVQVVVKVEHPQFIHVDTCSEEEAAEIAARIAFDKVECGAVGKGEISPVADAYLKDVSYKIERGINKKG